MQIEINLLFRFFKNILRNLGNSLSKIPADSNPVSQPISNTSSKSFNNYSSTYQGNLVFETKLKIIDILQVSFFMKKFKIIKTIQQKQLIPFTTAYHFISPKFIHAYEFLILL